MIKNYLKIAYRNILKNKAHSIVNITGLAIGMAACFFIFQYIYFESSYDRFHKNITRIYRVPISYTGSFSHLPVTASNHPAVGPAMKADFPEVLDFARVVHTSIFMQATTMSYDDQKGSIKTFNEERIYAADSSFLTMFSFAFKSGDPREALSQRNSMVISEGVAKKYFGEENPIGKSLMFNGRIPLKITGVFENVPANSHIKFDFLFSLSTIRPNWDDTWAWPEFYTYVLLAPGADPKKIEGKFPAFIEKYLGQSMRELNFRSHFHLQPVTDIHLKSNYLKEAEANGSAKALILLSIIGVFILVIAWVNYVNLSTAKSMERAVEVGLRKVVGARRMQLVLQFIFESVIINAFALIAAALIVVFLFPYFDRLTGENAGKALLSSALWQQSWFWLSVTAIFIGGAFVVGAYPAFVLSRFKPALAVKGRFYQTVKGISMRKVLVSFQFVLSILLIAGSIVVYKQLSYMRNQQLGYNQTQVLIVKSPAIYDSTILKKQDYFKTELKRNPLINDVSFSSDIPGKMIANRNAVRKANQDKTHNHITYLMAVDEDFINTFQTNVAAGRNFLANETHLNDENSKVIINEEVVRALGYKTNEEALHQPIVFKVGDNERRAEVIGVMKNYHQRSLKEQYDPILYYVPGPRNWPYNYIAINIGANNLNENITGIEQVYKKAFTGNAFQYFFLDEYFNRQYQADQQFGNVFTLFTFLAIVVACLGLLGLSSYVIKLRTKEIGIRKVLGASVTEVLTLFMKDFVKLVMVATVIATPVVYLTANKWLENYSFRVPLNWFVFIIPPVVLLFITFITISVQSLRAALTNPVKNLRTE